MIGVIASAIGTDIGFEIIKYALITLENNLRKQVNKIKQRQNND